jgi:DNA (cytosine-5)-methyltransferase 1
MARPTCIDLFAGAGGLSLGFEQQGFDVVAAVEIDPVHASVHKFNFPECAIIPRSVERLTGAEIRRLAGIGSRRVDVVVGGAPCQGFSLIGHRALDDPRNSLVREFVRIVGELDSSYFIFENVKGLTVGRHRSFLEEFIRVFAEIGYRVRTPWNVLNASSFGVPQDRERLFLLGAKEGLELPRYPEPTTCAADSGRMDLPAGPTCRDALHDLPDAERFAELWDGDEVRTETWGEPSRYAAGLRCTEASDWHYGYRRSSDPHVLTSSMRTDHTAISRRRFQVTKPGQAEPISRFFRLPKLGISNTLRAGTDSSRGAFTSPRPIHYEKARCVTVREMARLHGFPDWFRLHETKWHGARQIGNAVPPPLARAVAEEVMRALDVSPTRPERSIKLGERSLLKMDPTEAARYWAVPNPIGRRNMKSGARKRKQVEIAWSGAVPCA